MPAVADDSARGHRSRHGGGRPRRGIASPGLPILAARLGARPRGRAQDAARRPVGRDRLCRSGAVCRAAGAADRRHRLLGRHADRLRQGLARGRRHDGRCRRHPRAVCAGAGERILARGHPLGAARPTACRIRPMPSRSMASWPRRCAGRSAHERHPSLLRRGPHGDRIVSLVRDRGRPPAGRLRTVPRPEDAEGAQLQRLSLPIRPISTWCC